MDKLKLSYSGASTFRSCRKKYYWRYIKGFYPVIPSLALSLGKILHEGFDAFYKGAGDREVYKLIETAFDKEMSKQEVTDQENILINKYTALGMWANYPHKDLSEYTEVHSEEAFEIPLCDGVVFVGKVDGRILQYSNYWVRELKTTGLSKRQFEGRAKVSNQGTGYVYGLKQKGYDIKGIMYEYIKKQILRKGMTESVDMYGRRIIADYRNRPKFYYHRHLSYRTPIDMDNFKEDMTGVAKDILNCLSYYRNTDSCWNFNSECPYAKICFTEKPDPLTLELYYTRRDK